MIRALFVLLLVSVVSGFAPMGRMTTRSSSVQMFDVKKALGVAALG